MKTSFSVFIPARGGSKSIKDKNLQLINGISLVERSIKLALQRFEPKKIILSSDSEKILNIGKKFSVDLHLRSKEASNDTATTESAIKEWILDNNEISKWIILIEPTSPFIHLEDIDNLINLCNKNNSSSCVYSVAEVRHTDHYLNQRINNKGRIDFIFEELRKESRVKQKKVKTYKFGNISAIKSEEIVNSKKFFSSNSITFEVPFLRSINIDSKEELIIARALSKFIEDY